MRFYISLTLILSILLGQQLYAVKSRSTENFLAGITGLETKVSVKNMKETQDQHLPSSSAQQSGTQNVFERTSW